MKLGNSLRVEKSFSDKFAERFGIRNPVSFYDFVDCALYDADVGYYRRKKTRIGKSQGTDFYTSLSLKKGFASLLLASIENILNVPLREIHFIEIGSDDGTSILSETEHPFKSVITVPFGNSFSIPDNAVVFSNELIDAQPFHRFVGHGGIWKERAVYVDEDGSMKECLLSELTDSARETLRFLKVENPSEEGYQLDLPNLERGVLKEILQSAWSGLFITFDYGKSLAELLDSDPQGTARSYYEHKQDNDLLSHPGLRDITFHVCWDQVRKILEQYGFENIEFNRQGNFFIQNAGKYLEKQVHATGNGINPEMQQIKELLLHMGNAFQVMHGIRRK